MFDGEYDGAKFRILLKEVIGVFLSDLWWEGHEICVVDGFAIARHLCWVVWYVYNYNLVL